MIQSFEMITFIRQRLKSMIFIQFVDEKKGVILQKKRKERSTANGSAKMRKS
jgi:hypothetical protein